MIKIKEKFLICKIVTVKVQNSYQFGMLTWMEREEDTNEILG